MALLVIALRVYELFDSLLGGQEFRRDELGGRSRAGDRDFDDLIDFTWVGFENENPIGQGSVCGPGYT